MYHKGGTTGYPRIMMREGVNYARLCNIMRRDTNMRDLQEFARYLFVWGMRADMRESMRWHHCISTTTQIKNCKMEIVAMNRRQLRLHHHFCHRRPHYQAFVIIHLKASTKSGKVSVQPPIKGRRAYTYTATQMQERIDRNNFRRGPLSTSGYSTLRYSFHLIRFKFCILVFATSASFFIVSTLFIDSQLCHNRTENC